MMKKLRNNRGESLMETLVAILIFTMSSIIMYTMVTTAADINMTAKESDQANQAQMLVAEQGEGDGQEGTVSMKLTKAGSVTANQSLGTVEVEVFGESGDLYAYYVADSGAGGGT